MPVGRIEPTTEPGALARARSNVALVKYWGKRDVELNLPATGSLSLTLDVFCLKVRHDLLSYFIVAIKLRCV